MNAQALLRDVSRQPFPGIASAVQASSAIARLAPRLSLAAGLLAALPCMAQTTTTFNYTGAMQTFAVTAGKTYQFTVSGAQGGNSPANVGGLGARVTGGTVIFLTNDVLNILVGGQGASGSIGGGGGGASMVFDVTTSTLELVAGGGGGAASTQVGAGQGSFLGGSGYGAGGSNALVQGHGGQSCGSTNGVPDGAAGAGYLYNGGDSVTTGSGGRSLKSGGAGGKATGGAAKGGFGGGGAGNWGGGGGGGYTGGGCGAGYNPGGGGGGGSYVAEANNSGPGPKDFSLLNGVNSGNGQVIITELP